MQVIKKYFKNHPSIKQILENFQQLKKLENYSKKLMPKKTSGFDKISPTLVTLAAGVLAVPFSVSSGNISK